MVRTVGLDDQGEVPTPFGSSWGIRRTPHFKREFRKYEMMSDEEIVQELLDEVLARRDEELKKARKEQASADPDEPEQSTRRGEVGDL